jgi:hypothetical protein
MANILTENLMNYEIILSNGLEQFIFSYELNDDAPTKNWVNLSKETSPIDLRKSLNPWRGILSTYNDLVNDFNEVIDELNCWLPVKIENKWQINDPIKSLNCLHIHFPELEKEELDPIKRNQFTRFNDLIHGLQQILNKSRKENIYLLLCCDNSHKIKIDDEDFKFFKPYVNFGDLTLQYCHVGRHPIELFLSNDIDCPKDQIIPQYQYSSYHTLRFFTIPNLSEIFKNFYNTSKLSWPYKLEDPKLAVGYINLGKLKTINNKQYNNQKDIITIVKSCNKILDWQFNG